MFQSSIIFQERNFLWRVNWEDNILNSHIMCMFIYIEFQCDVYDLIL